MSVTAHSLRRAQARRTVYLSLIAVVLGVAGGGAAWVLVHLIGLITNVVLFHQWGWDLPSFADFHPGPILLVEAAAGGLAVALLAKWAPVIRGHGIPEAMEAILTRQSRIAPRAAVAKPVSAAIAIGTGGPFGAEGPIIVTGGAMGSLIGQLIRVTPSERKILLACGAAAGMSATFGAPRRGRARDRAAVRVPARSSRSWSSVAGDARGVVQPGPLFHVPTHDYAGLDSLPVFALIGITCGLLAVVICKGLFAVEAGFRKLRISEFWHPVVGALGFACVGLVVPRALGVGYDTINDILANRLAIGVLVALLLGKALAWWIALGSGTSGGTLAPILLISGAFGALLGAGVNELAPGLHLAPGAVALVAMAATFGSSTRATFTAIVFAFELTQDYRAILPIMLATVIADLVAGTLLDHRLMTEKLARRGVHVPASFTPDHLAETPVHEVMTTTVDTLPAAETVGAVRPLIRERVHRAYPLVDRDGRCVGIVSRTDLLAPDAVGTATLADVAGPDVVSVGPDEPLVTVLQRIVEEEVEHLPVLDADRHVVGMCTRTDVLAARGRHLDAESRQAGWSSAWKRRRTSTA